MKVWTPRQLAAAKLCIVGAVFLMLAQADGKALADGAPALFHVLVHTFLTVAGAICFLLGLYRFSAAEK